MVGKVVNLVKGVQLSDCKDYINNKLKEGVASPSKNRVNFCDEEKKRLALLITEIARLNEKKHKEESKIKSLKEENAKMKAKIHNLEWELHMANSKFEEKKNQMNHLINKYSDNEIVLKKEVQSVQKQGEEMAEGFQMLVTRTHHLEKKCSRLKNKLKSAQAIVQKRRADKDNTSNRKKEDNVQNSDLIQATSYHYNVWEDSTISDIFFPLQMKIGTEMIFFVQ